MAMDPVMGHPVLTPVGRLLVMARRPDVMVCVIAVIAGLPYISVSRRRPAPFIYRCGWPDANHDLRKRCRRDQSKSEQQCQCNFLHENRILQGLGACALLRKFPCCGNERCAAYSLRAHCDPHTYPLYHPDFLRDVPDCSGQHFPKKVRFRGKKRERGAPRSLFFCCCPFYCQCPSTMTQPSPRCSQRCATQTWPGCGRIQ